MMRVRWPGKVPLLEAAQYTLPDAGLLRGRGPWVWSHEDGYTVATHERCEAPSGDWRRGIGRYEVQMCDLPPLDITAWRKAGVTGSECVLPNDISVTVRPLSTEGRSIDWDGCAGRAITPYGVLAESVLTRIANGENVMANDADVLRLCHEALGHGLTMPYEIIYAYGLISDSGIDAILEAIADAPKP
jgi:hypothetical protein